MTGPIVLVETLAATHGIDARTALAKLSAAGLLDVGDDEYGFRNELTREIAYGTLTKAERARRHGLLAKTIAMDGERTGRIEEVMDRLAYHFNLAASLLTELGTRDGLPTEMAREAASFLSRAARRAEQREDWKSAEKYLNHALPLVDRDQTRRAARPPPAPRPGPRRAARHARRPPRPRRWSSSSRASSTTSARSRRPRRSSATCSTRRATSSRRPTRSTAPSRSGASSATRTGSPRRCASPGMTALFRANMEKANAEIEEALQPLPRRARPAGRGVGAAEPRLARLHPGRVPRSPRPGSRRRPRASARSATGAASRGRSGCSRGCDSCRVAWRRRATSPCAWSRRPASSATAGPGR